MIQSTLIKLDKQKQQTQNTLALEFLKLALMFMKKNVKLTQFHILWRRLAGRTLIRFKMPLNLLKKLVDTKMISKSQQMSSLVKQTKS